MQHNFEQAEKLEFTNYLNEQIQDYDRLIAETQQQLADIMDQITKIDTALLERQGIIDEQIAQLNVIRDQKIDLDKQIQLMMS